MGFLNWDIVLKRKQKCETLPYVLECVLVCIHSIQTGEKNCVVKVSFYVFLLHISEMEQLDMF